MPRATGFTLLELLIVITIAAGLAALALPRLNNAMGLIELKSGARQLATSLQAARARAIARDDAVALVVDVDSRTYRMTGEAQARGVSRDLALKLETAESEVVNERVAGIRFFPDGSSTGGRLTLAADGRRYVITVDWLTGRVRIHD